MISSMRPASVDEEATLPVGNRELRIRNFGVGEDFYACFALLCLLTRPSMLALLACLAY